MLSLIVRRGTYGMLVGTVTLFSGAPPPFVKYHGVWPRIRVVFTTERHAISKKVSLSRKSKQFTASFRPAQHGIMNDIFTQESVAACSRISEYEFLFDFDPIPAVAYEIADELKMLTRLYPGLAAQIGIRLEAR